MRIEITKSSNDSSGTIGYAEGRISGKDFTASWATFSPLNAIIFDSWLDASQSEVRAIAKALNDSGVVPKVGPIK